MDMAMAKLKASEMLVQRLNTSELTLMRVPLSVIASVMDRSLASCPMSALCRH